jgi:hypothetical protein
MDVTFSVGEVPNPPKVFISSTYYDLRPVREELESYLLDLGYSPVLFESAAPLPGISAPTSALRHASQADICCLIVGSRYGSMMDTGISWTHEEFRAARDLLKPIFTFVQKETLVTYELYRTRENKSFWVDEELKLFALIDEISTHGSRYPFASLPDLKETLRFHLISYYGYLIRRYAAIDLVSPRTAAGWNTLGVSESRRGEYGKGLFCYRQALTGC